MPDKLKARRAVRAAAALVALTGAALMVPPLVLTDNKTTTATNAVQAASRDSFTLSEPMTMSSEPRVIVKTGTLSVLRDVSKLGAGNSLLQDITGRHAALALDAAEVEIDLRSSQLEGAPSSSTSTGALSGGDILAAVMKSISSFTFRSLSLKDVALEIKLDGDRRERVMLQSAEFEMPKGGDRIVTGTLVYKGEPVAFDLAVGAPAPPASGAAATVSSTEAPKPVRATVRCKYLDGHFGGRLAKSDRAYILVTSATLSVPNVRRAARWLGESWPEGQGLGAFTARGGLFLDTRSIEFQNARFTLDGNSASGTLALRLGGDRPIIEGTLAFDAFNIGPYTAAKKQTPIAVVADWLSDLHLPGTAKPSLVTAIDADLRLSAKSIVSNAQNLGRTAASLNIKGGVLSAELAELELEQGGSGSGEFALDMRTPDPHFTVRAELHNVEFERALDNRIFASPLDGQGNVTVDLSGSGSHEDQLLSTLAGKVAIEMPDGGTLGLDLSALPAVAIPASPGSSAQPTWTRLGQGSTKLDRLVAKFSGRGGVFSADVIEARAGDVAITALGSLGVADGTMDMTVKTSTASASAVADAPLITGALPGEAKPGLHPVTEPSSAYRVRGPWASPAVSIVTNPGKSAELERAAPQGTDLETPRLIVRP